MDDICDIPKVFVAYVAYDGEVSTELASSLVCLINIIVTFYLAGCPIYLGLQRGDLRLKRGGVSDMTRLGGGRRVSFTSIG